MREQGCFRSPIHARNFAAAASTWRRRRSSFAGVRTIASLLLLGLLAACGTGPRHSTSAENFPVVEPFALDRAGAKASATFTLPGPLEGEDSLRPVFVGFRAVDKAGGTDAEFEVAQGVMDYLRKEAIPVRLTVSRLQDGQRVPVVLHTQHENVRQQRYWYEPHPDAVFVFPDSASTRNEPLIDAGHYDLDKAYYIHEFAQIVPPTPGRYVVEIESLQSHATLHGPRYELLVSHYYQHGAH